ncbi:MAG: hypothetical protein WC346_18150 [Methanogenium sp.]
MLPNEIIFSFVELYISILVKFHCNLDAAALPNLAAPSFPNHIPLPVSYAVAVPNSMASLGTKVIPVDERLFPIVHPPILPPVNKTCDPVIAPACVTINGALPVR